MLLNYLLKCVGDGHNRPVMAVSLSEEQLQYGGVEGLAPGPLYKRIFCLFCTKPSDQPLPLISSCLSSPCVAV